MIEKVREFVIEALSSKTSLEKMILQHLLDTEKYVEILHEKLTGEKPSEELLIAAVGHDIERAFRDLEIYEKMYKSPKGFLDKEFLDYHQKRSAEILKKFLETNSYEQKKIEKVYKYVSKHEVGGDFETDILKDADSISFFKNNVEHFVKVKSKESSPEKVREKLKWMFVRISFEESKKIIKKECMFSVNLNEIINIERNNKYENYIKWKS